MPKDCKMCEVGKQRSISLASFFDKLFRKSDAPEQSAPGEVLSRRVELSAGLTNESRWNYLVKFRLADGKEAELSVTEAFFSQAKEGLSGTVVWQDRNMVSFTGKE